MEKNGAKHCVWICCLTKKENGVGVGIVLMKKKLELGIVFEFVWICCYCLDGERR